MSLWQTRWYEYLSRFDYSIQYVEGVKNVVAGALSRMYAGRNDDIPVDNWVNADIHFDPEGETLPLNHLLESCAMQLWPWPQQPVGTVPRDPVELRTMESDGLRAISNELSRNVSQCPTRTANSQNLPALKKQAPTSRRTIRPVRKVGGIPLVDPLSKHEEVSCGGKSNSKLALAVAAQSDLSATRGVQNHNSPDMAGDTGIPGNTFSDRTYFS